MRTVEWSGHPLGDPSQAPAASPGLPARSAALGPATEPDQQRIGSRLLDPLAARHARQLAHADDLRAASAGELKSARKLGARYVVTDLESRLGDDWVLVRGLLTVGGGIGQVLIGPHGVIAMTSLHLDATVHCHGDNWRAEKPVRHDHGSKQDEHHGWHNETSTELSLDDQDGRSPSVQLNQAADVLEKFLHAAGPRFSVQRVILLNHPRLERGTWHRPTVNVLGSAADLLTWLNKLPKTLDRGQRRQIENLIAGDDHHRP